MEDIRNKLLELVRGPTQLAQYLQRCLDSRKCVFAGDRCQLHGGAKQDERPPNGFVFCLFALEMLIGWRDLSSCLRNSTASNSRWVKQFITSGFDREVFALWFSVSVNAACCVCSFSKIKKNSANVKLQVLIVLYSGISYVYFGNEVSTLESVLKL